MEQKHADKFNRHVVGNGVGVVYGARRAVAENLVRICDVLEISLSRLFAKNESELADAQKTELLSEFDRLSEEQRTALLNFIKHAM